MNRFAKKVLLHALAIVHLPITFMKVFTASIIKADESAGKFIDNFLDENDKEIDYEDMLEKTKKLLVSYYEVLGLKKEDDKKMLQLLEEQLQKSTLMRDSLIQEEDKAYYYGEIVAYLKAIEYLKK